MQALWPQRCWVAVELLRGPDDAAHLARCEALARAHGVPLLACGDVHMHSRARKRLQDVLTAVRLKLPLAQAGRQLLPNAERYLRPRYRLERIYPPELLAQTLAVAQRCTFSLDELRYEYPEEIVPPGETPATWLRKATYEEACRRYPQGMPERVRRMVEHELALIAQLQYEPYFLTVYDIVRFARSQGILCQGRGSAANSAVCYCLGITEVDPARMSTGALASHIASIRIIAATHAARPCSRPRPMQATSRSPPERPGAPPDGYRRAARPVAAPQVTPPGRRMEPVGPSPSVQSVQDASTPRRLAESHDPCATGAPGWR